jgi:cleavage and polyadenylation specificity factor subunit 3
MFLEAHFGDVELHMPDDIPEDDREAGEDGENEPSLLVALDEADARINLATMVRHNLSYIAAVINTRWLFRP